MNERSLQLRRLELRLSLGWLSAHLSRLTAMLSYAWVVLPLTMVDVIAYFVLFGGNNRFAPSPHLIILFAIESFQYSFGLFRLVQLLGCSVGGDGIAPLPYLIILFAIEGF